MLTVKEINEVSFGKAGFSGYKPRTWTILSTKWVTQLLAERDALQQEAQLDQQVKELTNQVAQLKAKNAELQKKLGILAQKIESYRKHGLGGYPQRPENRKGRHPGGQGQGRRDAGRRRGKRQAPAGTPG